MTLCLTRRAILSAAAVPLINQMVPAPVAVGSRQPVLVELFTSQGCSSCPPADALAGQLAKREGLVVVSFNVDYWDYLGWRDTLAKPEFTKRQRSYARARGDGDVYTPQMIFNGQYHAVGSQLPQVEAALNRIAGPSTGLSLQIGVGENDIRVDVGESVDADASTVWFLAVAADIDVVISRGENAGSTVTYHNVVRRITTLGAYSGNAVSFTMPRAAVATSDTQKFIAIVQRGTVGELLALTIS